MSGIRATGCDISSVMGQTGLLPAVVLCCALGGLVACKPPPPGPLDDLPGIEGLRTDPARIPVKPAEPSGTVGLSQIVVNYKGVFKPGVTPRWTHQQARSRAAHLAALARTEGQDFSDLARRFSNDSSTSADGGDMGLLGRGEMHPDLEEAAFGLGMGQVSDPVHTPRGFHVLLRHEPTETQAAEIVFTYTGAAKYTPRQPRTRAEAAELARQVHQRLLAGASFEAQARAHSDLTNHARGGFYPIFRKGMRHPDFEKIVWNIPAGGLSEIVETRTGFHIVSRWPVRRISGRVLRFDFLPEDADRRLVDLPDREEARALAVRARALLRSGADFATLVARNARGEAPRQGGLVERFGRGEIPYAVERVAFGLQVGQVSGVIEAEGAFFLFKRLP